MLEYVISGNIYFLIANQSISKIEKNINANAYRSPINIHYLEYPIQCTLLTFADIRLVL